LERLLVGQQKKHSFWTSSTCTNAEGRISRLDVSRQNR
jgi:hypothetical protein